MYRYIYIPAIQYMLEVLRFIYQQALLLAIIFGKDEPKRPMNTLVNTQFVNPFSTIYWAVM